MDEKTPKNEKMKQALLEWCERHAAVLNDDFCNAVDDLVTTIVQTTETPIDDAIVLAVKTPALELLHEFLAEQIDKIDGVENA